MCRGVCGSHFGSVMRGDKIGRGSNSEARTWGEPEFRKAVAGLEGYASLKKWAEDLLLQQFSGGEVSGRSGGGETSLFTIGLGDLGAAVESAVKLAICDELLQRMVSNNPSPSVSGSESSSDSEDKVLLPAAKRARLGGGAAASSAAAGGAAASSAAAPKKRAATPASKKPDAARGRAAKMQGGPTPTSNMGKNFKETKISQRAGKTPKSGGLQRVDSAGSRKRRTRGGGGVGSSPPIGTDLLFDVNSTSTNTTRYECSSSM